MFDLQLFNSLRRKKEVFKPLDAAHVKLYACGPTVYSYAHIGNARMAVTFDLLVRVLRYLYPRVTYVSNITDIDDKIMNAAQQSGEAIDDITQKYTKIYNEDMSALGALAPDIQPLATQHIDDMVCVIQNLIDRDHAYAADGHVLFHVPSFRLYGGLSGRGREEQIAGARVEIASYKKDPSDFVLWKPSNDDEPGWDSPWGRGRPGWHIECSAMSEVHLGLPFDIHGGGADLKFPHHENEIAQSCCAHGITNDLSAFSKYWVHNGFVTVNGEKMSKSLGNVVLAHDLLKDFPGEALRLTLLSAHYRQPLDWSVEKVQQSKKTLDKLYQRLVEMEDIEAAPYEASTSVVEALCDDLNTPQVIAELHALLLDDNSPEFKGQLLATGKLLGLLQEDPQQWLGFKVEDGEFDEDRIDGLLQERQEARAAKDFARADEIRDELEQLNIEIIDTPTGAIWKKAM